MACKNPFCDAPRGEVKGWCRNCYRRARSCGVDPDQEQVPLWAPKRLVSRYDIQTGIDNGWSLTELCARMKLNRETVEEALKEYEVEYPC